MGNQIFPYFFAGIYVIELGRFFRGTFYNFKTHEAGDPLQAQVFFGTPRAAFRYYMEQYNGMIKLPMINYNISNMERKTQYERATYLTAMNDFDPYTGKTSTMRFPSIFEITYSCQMWNNNLRERDKMIHDLINSFPMGDAWLLHYPDKEKYPGFFLPMSHKLNLTFNDETELNNLEPTDTRSRIVTSFEIICTRAFVPYQVYEIPVVSDVAFESYINYVEHGLPMKTLDTEFKASAQAVKSMLIDVGLTTVNISN